MKKGSGRLKQIKESFLTALATLIKKDPKHQYESTLMNQSPRENWEDSN